MYLGRYYRFTCSSSSDVWIECEFYPENLPHSSHVFILTIGLLIYEYLWICLSENFGGVDMFCTQVTQQHGRSEREIWLFEWYDNKGWIDLDQGGIITACRMG